MIYDLDININLGLRGVSEKQFLDIQNIIINSYYENKSIDFKTIDELFVISTRPYYTTSLNSIELNHNPIPQIIKIEISG